MCYLLGFFTFVLDFLESFYYLSIEEKSQQQQMRLHQFRLIWSNCEKDAAGELIQQSNSMFLFIFYFVVAWGGFVWNLWFKVWIEFFFSPESFINYRAPFLLSSTGKSMTGPPDLYFLLHSRTHREIFIIKLCTFCTKKKETHTKKRRRSSS